MCKSFSNINTLKIYLLENYNKYGSINNGMNMDQYVQYKIYLKRMVD